MTTTLNKREKIVQAATELFHQRGYTQSSLADIAGAAEIPLGNVYYYFRTKEALVAAVVEQRNEGIKAGHAALQTETSPLKRLIAQLQRIADGADWRAVHGCPMGGLAQEANKLGGGIAIEARSSMHASVEWFCAQFRELGLSETEARDCGVSLAGAIQGAILLGHTFKDPTLIQREMKRQQDQLSSAFKGDDHA